MQRPELAFLDVTLLDVDERYQRPVTSHGRRFIREIASKFSWALFGALTVARNANGRYAVLDGQHRLGAAKERGETEVPCLVVDMPDVTDQAMTFVAVNRLRQGVTPLVQFRAECAAGAPEACDVAVACGEAGVAIAASLNDRMRPCVLSCISAVRRCYKVHGRAAVVSGLRSIRIAFPTKKAAFDETVVGQVVRFVAAQGGVDEARLSDALARMEIDRVVANGRLEARNGGLSSGEYVYRAIAAAYSGSAAARPGRRAAPLQGVVAEARRRELAAKLPQPVQRRCQACQKLFESDTVGQWNCPSCEAKAA